MRAKQMLLSEQISTFLSALESAREQYKWALEYVDHADQLTQDYLHQLELTDTSYHDRARIAKELKRVRMERREAKNVIETVEPFVDFLNNERGKALVHQLQQVLGKVRKAEKNISLRQYSPRVLTTQAYMGQTDQDKMVVDREELR